MSRRKEEYALYEGDKFIDLGTIEYLAKREGVQPHTIMFYQSPSYKRRIKDKDNRKVLIKIERDY